MEFGTPADIKAAGFQGLLPISELQRSLLLLCQFAIFRPYFAGEFAEFGRAITEVTK